MSEKETANELNGDKEKDEKNDMTENETAGGNKQESERKPDMIDDENAVNSEYDSKNERPENINKNSIHPN